MSTAHARATTANSIANQSDEFAKVAAVVGTTVELVELIWYRHPATAERIRTAARSL